GDFPLDGTPREVPVLEITAQVTAPSGAEIVWMTPVAVVGRANAGLLGEQTTSCRFTRPKPIAVSRVE
ncbi:MAG: hypothetical protein ACK4N5_04535, partial [Myxococcales bacterium]